MHELCRSRKWSTHTQSPVARASEDVRAHEHSLAISAAQLQLLHGPTTGWRAPKEPLITLQ